MKVRKYFLIWIIQFKLPPFFVPKRSHVLRIWIILKHFFITRGVCTAKVTKITSTNFSIAKLSLSLSFSKQESFWKNYYSLTRLELIVRCGENILAWEIIGRIKHQGSNERSLIREMYREQSKWRHDGFKVFANISGIFPRGRNLGKQIARVEFVPIDRRRCLFLLPPTSRNTEGRRGILLW